MGKHSKYLEPLDEARLLIAAACEGRLTPEQAARLEKLGSNSREVRQLYIEMMHLSAWLHQHAAAMGAKTSFAAAGQDMNESMVLPAIRPEDVEIPEEQLLSAPIWEMPRRQTSKRRLWAAAAAVLIGLVAIAILIRSLVGAGGTPVATIVRSIDATWTGKEPQSVLLAQQDYSLDHGYVELNLSGTQVVVEGPARFSIADARHIDLASGKLTALVTGSGGVLVKTPTATVTDLGTEFGVLAGDAGTDIEVFQGHVSLASRAGGGQQQPAIVAAGAAERVDPAGHVLDLKPDSEKFVRAQRLDQWASAATQSAATRWQSERDRIRRDPSLAIYYTCDDPSRPGALMNEAEASLGQWDIPFTGDAPDWAAGRFPQKGALSFDPAREQKLLLPGYPFSRTGQLTVSAWVLVRERTMWGAIVKNRGGKQDGQFSLGLVAREGDLVARVTQKDGTERSVREGADSPLPTGRWMHVAFVADGHRLRLYRDGNVVASASCLPLTDHPVPDSLSIGFRSSDDGHTPLSGQPEYWSGKIDEIAIFHRGLSDQEVREMYEAGKPDGN